MVSNVIVLDHVLQIYNICLVQHKYRPQAGQETNFLWSAPSVLQKLHRMPFFLTSGMCVGISFASDDSSDFRLLVLFKEKNRC